MSRSREYRLYCGTSFVLVWWTPENEETIDFSPTASKKTSASDHLEVSFATCAREEKHFAALYTHCSIFQIYFVSYDDEGEVFWVSGRRLYEELVPPAVQRFERVGHCDVEHQHAAVGAPIERDAQRLKTLLPGRVPDLKQFSRQCTCVN